MEFKKIEKEFNEQLNVLVDEIKSSSKTYGEAIQKVRSIRFDLENGLIRQMYFEAETILEKEMKNKSIH